MSPARVRRSFSEALSDRNGEFNSAMVSAKKAAQRFQACTTSSTKECQKRCLLVEFDSTEPGAQYCSAEPSTDATPSPAQAYSVTLLRSSTIAPMDLI
ncbi:unnamed protein product [Heligmosomoides polygyrus]|uniref:DUF4189 domain-containing protein n=1 Tax=Heligmosomoides polygyrus TaxID=6339 RepID=A0A183F9G6_HELPZ|nr:unnamed protein product [Heligmosomoides polygyrus]